MIANPCVITSIKIWFERAVPRPVEKNQRVQLGVHIEEFSEMMGSVKATNLRGRLLLALTKWSTEQLATAVKTGTADLKVTDRVEFIDAICDQIVTATGCAHMNGMDVTGAINEVDASNWSKFVDGQPVFDSNGKIAKGPYYFKPSLARYAG